MYKIIIHQPDKTGVNHVTQMIMDNQCKSVDLLQELNPSCFSLTKKNVFLSAVTTEFHIRDFNSTMVRLKAVFKKAAKACQSTLPGFKTNLFFTLFSSTCNNRICSFHRRSCKVLILQPFVNTGHFLF